MAYAVRRRPFQDLTRDTLGTAPADVGLRPPLGGQGFQQRPGSPGKALGKELGERAIKTGVKEGFKSLTEPSGPRGIDPATGASVPGGGVPPTSITGEFNPELLRGMTPTLNDLGAPGAAETLQGSEAAAAAGIAAAGQGINAGAELGMGIGATLPEVGVGLGTAASWAALPFAIFAASGAFGKGAQGIFGNNEQVKNQAHEARVLGRDLAVAGPQAQAGQQAAFDLGDTNRLTPEKLQQLEHAIRTGLGAGPVFSRAGGPDRGTQDLDLQIGFMRATDALTNRGLKTLTGATPSMGPESLAHLSGYAKGSNPAVPYSFYGESYLDENTGQGWTPYAWPSSSPSGFPAGKFEQGVKDYYGAQYPDFANSQLAQRMLALSGGAPGTTTPGQEGTMAAPSFLAGRPPQERGVDESIRLHQGGVVPGRPGSDVKTTLQAGETVLPTGFAGMGHRGGAPLSRIKSMAINFHHDDVGKKTRR